MSRNIGLEDIMGLLGQFMPPASVVSAGAEVLPVGNPRRIPIDMVEEEKTIHIYAEIPGVTKENIKIDCYNNKMTISAEKVRAYESPSPSELKYGRLHREITLPICVTKPDTVAVNYDNGVLRIRINKFVEEENRFSIQL